MIAFQLLQILVAFLVLVSALGVVVVLIEWWQMRRPLRVPPPPLSNDERVRRYQENARAYGGLRNG